MPKATLEVFVEGPNASGDYIVHAEDFLRGKFNFPLHPQTKGLTIEGQTPPPAPAETTSTASKADGDAGATAPAATTPVLPGPQATREELLAFCKQDGITHHHRNSVEALQAAIQEKYPA